MVILNTVISGLYDRTFVCSKFLSGSCVEKEELQYFQSKLSGIAPTVLCAFIQNKPNTRTVHRVRPKPKSIPYIFFAVFSAAVKL